MLSRLRVLGLVVAVIAVAGLGYWLVMDRGAEAPMLAEPEAAGLTAPATAPPETVAPPTTASPEPATRGLGGLTTVKASRLFAGPTQFPPDAFAAYGIVAFRARVSSGERERYMMLCEAYIAALPRSDELTIPIEEQMVTVWPIADDATADALNERGGPDVCQTAIDRYGLTAALQAIGDAGEARIDLSRRGPFLLAWSPSIDKGDPDALMLVADLTDVTTYAQAEAFFVLWRTDIEANPEYWNRGWDVEKLRIAIRLWVDRYGSQIFSILGG